MKVPDNNSASIPQEEVETRSVSTVDYRSSPGQCQEQRSVEVIHQSHDTGANSATGGGVIANAAASIASTIQSAKDAISK